jgi:phosphatidylcholine synthase
MNPAESPGLASTSARTAALAVHVFTACGAGLALLALIAAVLGNWSLMFLWLGIALVIDGVDGSFARLLRVGQVLPRWSGDVLDLVVDILTYVFVPAYAIVAGGLLPPALAVPLGVVIVVTSALYFADRQMKTSDHYFRGFPALWNAAAFYLFLLRLPPWLAALMVAALAALTFAPFCFVHPVRVARLRGLTTVALLAWAVLGVVALIDNLDPGFWIVAGLCLLAVYFVSIGFLPRQHPDGDTAT